MSFNEYSKEVKKYYLKHFSKDLLASAEKCFMSDEAQEIVQERFECYTTNKLRLRGAVEPETVAYCLDLMWE